MRILVASDKFKGSMSALQSCAALSRGVRAVFDEGEVEEIPIADGGEGTANAIRGALGGERVSVPALDALGREVNAGYSLVEESDGGFCAAMEMSVASGLWRLREGEMDPRRATTFGTGQLMVDAMARGAEKLIVGIGGSATNDGGAGMARALGYRFLDASGGELDGSPESFENLASIAGPVMWDPPEVVVACDVSNPLLGERGATRVYGEQKGIAPGEFEYFEERLARLVEVVERDVGCNWSEEPGAGAAGGLGFGLLSFCGAKLQGGFELVADLVGLEAAVRSADLVLTGEGKIDAQTAQGKAPAGVGEMARRYGVPVVAFCGVAVEGEVGETFDGVVSIRGEFPDLDEAECLGRGEELLEETARGAGEFLRKVLQKSP